jgi:hypothetical protein
MQELITYLLHFKRFTPTEIELIKSTVTSLTLEKRGFLRGADAPGDPAFIVKGILRVFYLDGKGNEITEYFIDENNFVLDPDDNSHQPTSARFRQAIIKTELAVLSNKALERLSSGIAGWDQVVKELRARARADQEDRLRPTMAGDATACYKEFIDKYSRIASRVPLSYLASYLGITQQSLSRVRRQLAKNVHPRK